MSPAPPKLYIEGHNHRLGYAISVELMAQPPVRYYQNIRQARRLVDKFNGPAARRHRENFRPA